MPFCPKCRTEYDPGVAICVDCETPLVGSLPPEHFGPSPVIAFESMNANEAQVVAATLESEGVPAYVDVSNALIPQFGQVSGAGVPTIRIWVPAEAEAQAAAVVGEGTPTDAELVAAEEADVQPHVEED